MTEVTISYITVNFDIEFRGLQNYTRTVTSLRGVMTTSGDNYTVFVGSVELYKDTSIRFTYVKSTDTAIVTRTTPLQSGTRPEDQIFIRQVRLRNNETLEVFQIIPSTSISPNTLLYNYNVSPSFLI